jgi:hypothetical protein
MNIISVQESPTPILEVIGKKKAIKTKRIITTAAYKSNRYSQSDPVKCGITEAHTAPPKVKMVVFNRHSKIWIKS